MSYVSLSTFSSATGTQAHGVRHLLTCTVHRTTPLPGDSDAYTAGADFDRVGSVGEEVCGSIRDGCIAKMGAHRSATLAQVHKEHPLG